MEQPQFYYAYVWLRVSITRMLSVKPVYSTKTLFSRRHQTHYDLLKSPFDKRSILRQSWLFTPTIGSP
jgi:hypothetical protein